VKKSQNKKNNTDSKSVWFLLLGSGVVTLYFRTDFYDPFNSAKLILLLILSSWILGHLVHSYKSRFVAINSIEFFGFLIVLLFVGTLLISTFKTESFNVGLLGETQRRNGFLAYLGLSIILLFASRTIDFLNVDKIYKVGIVLGLILATYGIMQVLGRDFQSWDNPYNAMIGTLGNPNFASAMLALLVLLSIYSLFIPNIAFVFKLLSLVVITGGLFAIIESNSRQGLIVILFSLVFYLTIYGFIKHKWIGTINAILGGLLVFFTLLGMLKIGPMTSLIYKESVSVRGYYWRAGIEMFKSSPLFGVGVDRYLIHFKQFRELEYPLKFGFELTSSNAHNIIIQLFATAGIFVGIAYLSLLIFIFVSGIRVLRVCGESQKPVTLGLLATWLGFQAQSLISIDNIGIAIWGWLLSGAILGLRFNGDLGARINFDGQDGSRKNQKVKINFLQPLISTILLVFTLAIVIPVYRSETYLLQIKNISSSGNAQYREAALQQAGKLLNYKFIDPNYKYMTAFYLNDLGYTDQAYKIILDLVGKDPDNLDFIRGAVALEEARNNITSVISFRERMLTLDPWNFANYVELMKLYLDKGNKVQALILENKILQYAPNTEIAKTATELLR
jgi:O-antigen ligase